MSVKRWIGNAATSYDLWTVSLSGTVVSQNYSMTINGKSIIYAAGSGDTVATILAGLVSAWNIQSPLPPPEFQELIAAGLPIGGSFTSMTLTQKTAGKPSSISVSTDGAATFTITNTTPGTGPNDFANSQNWSGGVAPANSDTLVFDSGSVPCKYNLNTTLMGITVNVNAGYAGSIGLPFINSDSTSIYAEYRPISLTLAGGTVAINAPSLTRCNLDFGANNATVRVLNCGQRPDKLVPVVLVKGGASGSELDVLKGDVGLANYQGQTATFPTINMGFVANAGSDANLFCGPGAVLTTINKNGGNLTVNSAVNTITQGPSGGVTTVVDGAITTLSCQGGSIAYNSSGTLGTLSIANGGSVSFDGDPRAVTVTNAIKMYGDKSSVSDAQKRVNSGTLTVSLQQTAALNINHGVGSLVTLA